jgi:hypothetical protein
MKTLKLRMCVVRAASSIAAPPWDNVAEPSGPSDLWNAIRTSSRAVGAAREQAGAGNELLLRRIEQVAPSTHSMEASTGSMEASTGSREVRK